MRSDILDLLVERRLGNLAFFDIQHQAAIGSDEANVQALFEFVPLAADHDAVSIAIRLRAGDDGCNESWTEPANALEQVADLLVLQAQLRGIGQVLILAAAALAKVRTKRLHPFG